MFTLMKKSCNKKNGLGALMLLLKYKKKIKMYRIER